MSAYELNDDLVFRWLNSDTGQYDSQLAEVLRNQHGAKPTAPALPSIPVNGADMVVHVVMPGGNVLTLADREELSPGILATVSERDKKLMRTLLMAASDELNPPFDYSTWAQQPMPAFPIAPRQVK